MNEILKMLSGGNLQSDGKANEAADWVITHPYLFDQMVEGLFESDDVIRARTAHALERISRTHPEMVLRLLPQFIDIAITDPVPMVKWHLAMIFGNLPLPAEKVSGIVSTLFRMLDDPSVFVKSWTIVSLTILGRKHSTTRERIADKIRPLQNDRSVSIRTKVLKALKVLENDSEPIPTGWIKAGAASALLH
jgi:HEAT repeat protein